MVKYFCDVCGKEMSATAMMYAWSIRAQGEGTANKNVIDKAYNCVCNDCKSRIFIHISNLQNSSNEGETNG